MILLDKSASVGFAIAQPTLPVAANQQQILAVEVQLGSARRLVAALRPPPGWIAGLAFRPRPPARPMLRFMRLRVGHLCLHGRDAEHGIQLWQFYRRSAGNGSPSARVSPLSG